MNGTAVAYSPGMQPKLCAVVISTLSFAPLIVGVLLVPVLKEHLAFGGMLLFAIGFLMTTALCLVGGALALVVTYHRLPRWERPGFLATAIVSFAVPWAIWLLLVATG